MHGSYVRGLPQGSEMNIDSQVCHGYIIGDKAMKVRMPRCELKWVISAKI